MSDIPSRLRKTTFDRFAPVLGQALRQFPRALVVDPSPLSTDSYNSTVRNAIKGKKLYNYSSSHINEIIWAKNIDKLVVASRADGMIVLGDSVTVKEPAGAKYGQRNDLDVLELLDNKFLPSLCVMLSARALRPQPQIRVSKVDTNLRLELEQYDIAIIEQSEPGSYIIL